MEISKAGLGAVTAVCLLAGAAGAYLASRPAPEPLAAQLSDSQLSEASLGTGPSGTAVEASEAIVQPEPPPVEVERQPRAGAVATRRPAREAAPSAGGTRRREPAPRPERPAESFTAPPALAPAQQPAPAREIAPPEPQFEELVVSAESVIGLEVETPVSSEDAQVEDEVVARITRDVRVGDRVAIPAGAKAHGEVTLVERGGKMRNRARLGVRFTSIVLADGTRVPVDTDVVYREGSSPGNESAAKIGGGAIGGAIIGGILGGARGAIIGGSAGAGAGAAAVLGSGRNPATLPAGAPITIRLVGPASVSVEK